MDVRTEWNNESMVHLCTSMTVLEITRYLEIIINITNCADHERTLKRVHALEPITLSCIYWHQNAKRITSFCVCLYRGERMQTAKNNMSKQWEQQARALSREARGGETHTVDT